MTFSCYGRRPYLGSAEARSLFERALETMRVRYDFFVSGDVVMPEHVHLLVSEPQKAVLAKALQALKLSVAVKRENVRSGLPATTIQRLYRSEGAGEAAVHARDPAARGLVGFAESWAWSSARHYWTGEAGVVEVESPWTAARRERNGCPTSFLRRGFTGSTVGCGAAGTQVSDARPGARGLPSDRTPRRWVSAVC